MNDLGYRNYDIPIDFKFTTASTLSGATVKVYKFNSLTSRDVTSLLTADFNSIAGLNHIRLDSTELANSFYSSNSADFVVVVTVGTVSGQSIPPLVVATWCNYSQGLNINKVNGTAFDDSAQPGFLPVNAWYWKDVIITAGSIPAAVAGASGGLFISGTNSSLTITGTMTISNGLVVSRSSSNTNAVSFTGNGTGAGLVATGGATGIGCKFVGGGTSGVAFNLSTTSGDAINIAPTAGNGITIAANGTSKHGMNITGGTAGTSNGVTLTAGSGGVALSGATFSFDNTGQTTNLPANVKAFNGTNGTFVSGRPEVLMYDPDTWWVRPAGAAYNPGNDSTNHGHRRGSPVATFNRVVRDPNTTGDKLQSGQTIELFTDIEYTEQLYVPAYTDTRSGLVGSSVDSLGRDVAGVTVNGNYALMIKAMPSNGIFDASERIIDVREPAWVFNDIYGWQTGSWATSIDQGSSNSETQAFSFGPSATINNSWFKSRRNFAFGWNTSLNSSGGAMSFNGPIVMRNCISECGSYNIDLGGQNSLLWADRTVFTQIGGTADNGPYGLVVNVSNGLNVFTDCSITQYVESTDPDNEPGVFSVRTGTSDTKLIVKGTPIEQKVISGSASANVGPGGIPHAHFQDSTVNAPYDMQSAPTYFSALNSPFFTQPGGAGPTYTNWSLTDPLHNGTAQAGASTTITLSTSASSTNSIYVGSLIRLTSGTGQFQTRIITAYNGSTKVATVNRAWTTNPTNSTTYAIMAADSPKVDSSLTVDSGTTGGLSTVQVQDAIHGYNVATNPNGYGSQSAAAYLSSAQGQAFGANAFLQANVKDMLRALAGKNAANPGDFGGLTFDPATDSQEAHTDVGVGITDTARKKFANTDDGLTVPVVGSVMSTAQGGGDNQGNIIVTPALVYSSNPRYSSMQLAMIAAESGPTDVWSILDPRTKNPIDLSGKTLVLTFATVDDEGDDDIDTTDDTLNYAFQYITGEELTIGGTDHNVLTIVHNPDKTGTPGRYRAFLWDATNPDQMYPLVKAELPIEPAGLPVLA